MVVWIGLPSPATSAARNQARGKGTSAQPNVVIILTDDQRAEEIQGMPTVERELLAKGISFSNAIISNPLCCPSRAAILTGQYSHDNGVYTNGGGSGGWSVFKAKDETHTLATALHDVGYRTALIGKYLNGYSKPNAGHIPAGWDRWFTLLGGTNSNWYYDYWVSDQGTPTFYGASSADYSTDVLAGKAVDVIDTTPADQPVFLYFAPFAPHEPSIPPDRYLGITAPTDITAQVNFNEADVSDKPAYIQNTPPQDPAAMTSLWNGHWGASKGVDDATGSILNALAATGRLNNTLIVYLSDQGVALGAHRWKNKEVPYEEVIKTPLIMRWDALGLQPRVEPSLVGNVDLAPTIVAAAGASLPGMDGQDLMPLMQDPATPWRSWFLLEHGTTVGSGETVPGYCGVRTQQFTYVEYVTGERELYDLALDPFELVNVASDPAYADTVTTLHRRLSRRCPTPPLFGSNGENT